MASATSCSKRWFYPTLWKKNMLRFWPIWAVYLTCWLLAMPVELLNSGGGARWNFAQWTVRSACTWPAVVAAGVFGILSAMAVFSYLYNNRSVGMLHALPVRREGLFWTNYLSGLSFMVLPQVVITVLMLLLEAALDCLDPGALAVWLLIQAGATLFFYSFAVFCAMFTGHILALPVFYGILNFLALGMCSLVNFLLEVLLFGYNNSADGMMRLAMWLTPAGKMLTTLHVQKWNMPMFSGEGAALEAAPHLSGGGYVLIYAVAGIILAALALVVYRRRHLEGAGDVITVGWVKPVFKYGVAFCSALALGTGIYTFFFSGNLSGSGFWGYLATMLVCGAVGCLAAEMLLRKSFRVWGRAWKGCLAFSGALVVLAVAIRWDLVGFERRIPDAIQVASVSIGDVSSSPEDSASYLNLNATEDREYIQAVLQLHQSIVDRRDIYRDAGYAYTYEEGVVDGLKIDSIQTERTVYVQIKYLTISGKTINREYKIPVRQEDLTDESSPAAQLAALLNRPQDKAGQYFGELLEPHFRLMEVSVEGRSEGVNWNDLTIPVDQDQRQALLDAVLEDMAAGRLGVRSLLRDADYLSNCYDSALVFTFEDTRRTPDDDGVSRTYSTVWVTLQRTAVSTLALLEEMDMESQGMVLETQAELQYRERNS